MKEAQRGIFAPVARFFIFCRKVDSSGGIFE